MKRILLVLILATGNRQLATGASMAVPEFNDSGVSQKASALVAVYFTDASAALKKIVLHPPGTTASSREYRQAFAAQKVQQIDRILSDLKAKTSGWVGKHVPQAYRDGLKLAHSQAVDAGVQPKDGVLAGEFTLIDRRTVQQFALDTVMDLHKAADSIGDRAGHVLRQTAQMGLAESEINRILAGGVIAGRPADTIRTLKVALKKIHGDTVEIAGRNYEVGYYAEMVARTKTREASVKARHERLQELGLDLVSIVGRQSNYFCSEFLGQVYSLSGNHPRYPSIEELPGGGPPFHPNCSKSTRPFVEALANKDQLDRAEPTEEAAELFGLNAAEAQKVVRERAA